MGSKKRDETNAGEGARRAWPSIGEFDIANASDRDALVLEHVPLLRHIVGRMAFDLPGGLDRDDLFGFGMLGLLAAADSWDKSRGFAFSTYAYPRIRGAILDELRRMDFLPRGRRERVRELERVVAEGRQLDGTPPSPEEIAAALGIGLDEVDEILLAARSSGETSLDGDGDGDGGELGSLLDDPKALDPVGSAEWTEMRELLAEAIAELPEQDRTVITLYYAEELLLREISGVLGVTESRVSQIHTRALYRLNRALSARIGAPGGS